MRLQRTDDPTRSFSWNTHRHVQTPWARLSFVTMETSKSLEWSPLEALAVCMKLVVHLYTCQSSCLRFTQEPYQNQLGASGHRHQFDSLDTATRLQRGVNLAQMKGTLHIVAEYSSSVTQLSTSSVVVLFHWGSGEAVSGLLVGYKVVNLLMASALAALAFSGSTLWTASSSSALCLQSCSQYAWKNNQWVRGT